MRGSGRIDDSFLLLRYLLTHVLHLNYLLTYCACRPKKILDLLCFAASRSLKMHRAWKVANLVLFICAGDPLLTPVEPRPSPYVSLTTANDTALATSRDCEIDRCHAAEQKGQASDVHAKINAPRCDHRCYARCS